MNIVLVQFREKKITCDHEFDCFVKKTGLHPRQFYRINMLSEHPTNEQLHSADAIIFGGSGEFLISSDDIPDARHRTGKITKELLEKEIPMLSICFGAQILADVLDGKVEKDEERAETGSYKITKNTLAQHCPIFENLPNSFYAQLGHKDHITKLPSGMVNVASSVLSEHQAFTVPGKPVYAFTYHPELDEEAVLYRLDHYAEMYDINRSELDIVRKGLRNTGYAEGTLRLFLDEVVQKKRYHFGKE